MKKRFIAFLVALFLLLPQLIFTAEAFEATLNPFGEFDALRNEALKNARAPFEEAIENAPKRTVALNRYYASYGGEDQSGKQAYVVKFSDALSLYDIYKIVKDMDFSLLADSSDRLFRIRIDDYGAFAEKYRNYISYISEDLIRTTAAVTNDPYLPETWAFGKMDIFRAWDYTTGKSEVVVAVLDTGIERRHEDFAGTNIVAGYDTVTKTVGVSIDTSGHGTEICGLIAATANNGKGSAGVAYSVSIMPVRVSTASTTIYSSNLIAGIRFAADAGAKVINMSLGSYSSSDAEREAVNYALRKGCILVSSAGNEGETLSGSEKMYPASYDGVISVASVDINGNVSKFSQHNDAVDIAAPGEDIFVMLYTDDKSAYTRRNGTSYSAAYVSGIAALAASYLNDSVRFGSEEFMSLLRSISTVKRTDYYGYGVINALKILKNVNYPIVTGVADGETYYSSVTIRFNRGSATLDGIPINSGEVVYENGSHTLVVSDGEYSKTIRFTVDNSPLSYEYKEESSYAVFTFKRGTATLDGFPYASGQHITASGEHVFELTGEYSNTITKRITLNFELPYVSGVTDNGVYDTAVCIRVIGTGSATLNGSAFSGEIVVGTSGQHKLVVYNGNKSKSRTYNFTIQNGNSASYQSDFINAKAIVDQPNGYIALYSQNIQGIRIYDVNNPTVSKKFINIGKANGYAFWDDYLLIFHGSSVTKLNRSRILNQTNPVESIIDMGENISAVVLYDTFLYYASGKSLKKYDLNTGKKTTLASLTINADKAFVTPDGAYLYLLSSRDNTRSVNLFYIRTGELSEMTLPVGTFEKSFAFGSNMLAVGSSVFLTDRFEKISENSAEKCLLISGGLLFTDQYIINAETNKYLAVFREKVSDIVIGNGGTDSDVSREYSLSENSGQIAASINDYTVYVFYTDGSIDIIKNTSDPVRNFSPSNFRAAPYNDALIGTKTQNTVYDSFSEIFPGRKITSMDSDGSKLFFLCEGVPALYVVDAKTLTQAETVPLRYIPRQAVVSGNKLYISFKNQSVIYSTDTALPGGGKYTNIGYTPQSFSVENDKIAAISNSFVMLTDLNTETTIQTGLTAYAVRISGGKLYIASSNYLNIYNLNTLAAEGSLYTGLTTTSFTINGDYAIIGGRVYSISQKAMLFNTYDTILGQRGNTVITNNGVYSISDEMFISSYKISGSQFYLSPEFDFYYVKDDKIMLAKSANGMDLTEPAQITGIENGGSYQKSVTISFSSGVGYVDDQKIESGSYYNAGGHHTFTLVLSCGIKQTIKFYIQPVLTGIEIVGGNRSINVGDKINLSVRYLPAGSSAVEVVFSTENPDIVQVTPGGTVTGLQEGNAVVKATAVQGGFTAECVITVSRMLIEFKKDSGFMVDRNYELVTGIALGTYADELVSAIQTEGVAEVLDLVGNRTDGIVGTGMYLVLKSKEGTELDRLKLSVRGDISGDGYLSAEDLYGLAGILELKDDYEAAYIFAADIDGSGLVTNADMSALKAQLMGYGSSLTVKNKPPVNHDIGIKALVKTNIYDGEKIFVTIQLENARGVYAVSGRLKFNPELISYIDFQRQSWNDTIYLGDGFVSFISYSEQKEGSKTNTKNLLTFEFKLKSDIVGRQVLLELDNAIAVADGRSYSLPESQTLRKVKEYTYGSFNIRLNNVENFVFSPDVYEYEVTVGPKTAFLDVDTEYPEGGKVYISDTVIPDSGFLEVSIVYVEPDGSSFTYIIEVRREAEYIPDSNCYLESLTIENFPLIFDKTISDYLLVVPYEVERLNIKYKAESEACRVDLYNPELKVGQNLIKITCVAESGAIRIYTITVTREEKKTEIEQPAKGERLYDNPVFYVALSFAFVAVTGAYVLVKSRKKKAE